MEFSIQAIIAPSQQVIVGRCVTTYPCDYQQLENYISPSKNANVLQMQQIGQFDLYKV